MQKIFDSHLHLWDLTEMSISWIKNKERLNQNYSYERVKEEYQDFMFLGAMYVEVNADNQEEEALFALNQKKLYGLLLCLANIKNLKDICAFREVMHIGDKGARRLFDKDFQEIIKHLKQSHKVLEVCVKNEELYFLEKFAREHFDLKIVLNHMGNPQINSFNEYKKNLQNLKKFPHFFIKLSVPDNFSKQTPWEFILELFAFLKENCGEERLLFGSNYPVAKIAPSQWARFIVKSDIFKDLDSFFYLNALSLYKGE